MQQKSRITKTTIASQLVLRGDNFNCPRHAPTTDGYRKRYPPTRGTHPLKHGYRKQYPAQRGEWHLMAFGYSALNGIQWQCSLRLLNGKRK